MSESRGSVVYLRTPRHRSAVFSPACVLPNSGSCHPNPHSLRRWTRGASNFAVLTRASRTLPLYRTVQCGWTSGPEELVQYSQDQTTPPQALRPRGKSPRNATVLRIGSMFASEKIYSTAPHVVGTLDGIGRLGRFCLPACLLACLRKVGDAQTLSYLDQGLAL